MRERYYHQKLIRDRIPEFIQATNDDSEIRVLDDAEFEIELKKKLIEEAKEASQASDEELLNELADVLELIKSIADHHGIDFEEVEKYQLEKRKKRGGFLKRLFLVWSTGKGGR